MSWRPSRFVALLLAITALALAVRVGYVLLEKWDEPVVGDQIFYNAESNRLAEGSGFVVPFDARNPLQPGKDPAADHPPLTVVTLVPVSWAVANLGFLDGEALKGAANEQRLVMAVIGALGVALIGLVGRAVAGDRVGLLAAGIAAVYPNVWVNDGLVMAETLTMVAVVLALLLAYRLARAPTLLTAAALGAACGLAALARAEQLLLVPLLLVPAVLLVRQVAARRRLWLLAVGFAATIVVIGPWIGFNLTRFDEPTFLSTNDGLTLLGANCDRVYHGGGTGLWAVQCVPPIAGDQSVASAEYRRRGVDYLKAHTGRVPAVVLARVGRVWGAFRPGDMLSYNQGEGRERWVTAAGMWFFYPLVALAIAGIVVLRRSLDRLWPLLAPIVIVTVVAAATYGQTRFRGPAEPSLVVLAAVAIGAGVRWWGRARRAEGPSSARASVGASA